MKVTFSCQQISFVQVTYRKITQKPCLSCFWVLSAPFPPHTDHHKQTVWCWSLPLPPALNNPSITAAVAPGALCYTNAIARITQEKKGRSSSTKTPPSVFVQLFVSAAFKDDWWPVALFPLWWGRTLRPVICRWRLKRFGPQSEMFSSSCVGHENELL